MPPLGPRIGIEQEDALEALIAKMIENVAGIAIMEPDIGQPFSLDGGQSPGDAIEESFAADKPDVGIFVLPARSDAQTRRSRFPATLHGNL